MSHIDALQVSSTPAGPALTPSQKRFNTLIRQIEQARQTLAAWNENTAAYRQAHVEVLKPLQAELLAGHRQWVWALDAALEQRNWTHAERGTLRELLCEAAGEMLDARGDDSELKALFDKHAEVDFDTEQRERMLAMKGLAEAMTGLDLGDDEGIDSDAQLLERLHQGLQEQVASQEAQRGAKAGRRRKSVAQQRREAEARQATQSVREVYRKLASALHPDREPDERQREAKTALMQRVNQAYESNDLLALLELQLQIEQIDASHIANAGEQRLKHYNKVLGEQLAELKAELEHVEVEFCMEFGLEPGRGVNPRKLGLVLEQTSRQWRAELDQQQRELRMLCDAAATKRWLKRQQRREAQAAFVFAPF
ncbi:J domain-containing protein [Variovorax sp. J22R133]|uniref:J domain-containing protein n=1 Tax=Variovorax brevis TaxID=3053503 RepID=UPI0025769660|nr:J domain-containing protein [Variovorax sp. J22R133]MDM0117501.1 J domain-containing protein [Variovorax sp. J22R133]